MAYATTLTTILLVSINVLGAVCRPTVHSSRDVTNVTKAGLAWPNGDSADIKQYESDKISWYYTWSAFSTDTDLEFVPMLWGPKSVDQFASTIDQTLSSGSVKAVLGMNEPEQQGQSNMSPQDGANMWKAYLEPLRPQNVRLGSPAPSSAPAGKTWLQDFLIACGGGCTVDFIALHWYGTNASQFIDYMNDYHNTFQRPLWITEWACQNFVDTNAQCSQDDVILFLNKTQTFLDSSDFVERYAWFGAMKDMQGVNAANAIMDSNGKITALGKQYTGAEAPISTGSGNADGPGAPGGGNGGSGGGGVIISSAASSSVSISLITIGLIMPTVVGFFS